MSLDHFAIYKAYAGVVKRICDDENAAYDIDDNKIELEQSKIDAARSTLNSEATAVKYKTDRTTDGSTTYASIGDQLDMLYKDIVAGTVTTSGTWATHIKLLYELQVQ